MTVAPASLVVEKVQAVLDREREREREREERERKRKEDGEMEREMSKQGLSSLKNNSPIHRDSVATDEAFLQSCSY